MILIDVLINLKVEAVPLNVTLVLPPSVVNKSLLCCRDSLDAKPKIKRDPKRPVVFVGLTCELPILRPPSWVVRN